MSRQWRYRFVRSIPAWITSSVGLFALGGLNCDATPMTVELPASKLATVNNFKDNNNHSEPYCLGLLPYGAFEGLAEGTAKVGYARNYDPGTPPFACWWWWANVDRGLVQFDLSSVDTTADRITGATLEFDLSTKFVDPNDTETCPNDLLSSIWIVNEPWSNKFNPAADFMTGNTPMLDCVPNHHSVDASQAVRDWFSGARPNYGFLFIGWDESTPANDEVEYKTTLQNVKLKVIVGVPVGP